MGPADGRVAAEGRKRERRKRSELFPIGVRLPAKARNRVFQRIELVIAAKQQRSEFLTRKLRMVPGKNGSVKAVEVSFKYQSVA